MATRRESDPFADDFGGFDVAGASSAQSSFSDTLDFTEVPDEIKYEVLPPGWYNGYIDSVEFGVSSNGNEMLTWIFKVSLPDGRERTQFYHTVLKDSGLIRLKRLLVRLQPYANEEFTLTQFNPHNAAQLFTGVPCRIRLRTNPYQGQLRNSVSDVVEPETDMSQAVSK